MSENTELGRADAAVRKAIESFNKNRISTANLQLSSSSQDKVAGQSVFTLQNIVPTRDISLICDTIKQAVYPCRATFPINDLNMKQLTCVVSLPALSSAMNPGTSLHPVAARRSSCCWSLCKFCSICTAVSVAAVGIGIAVLNILFPMPQHISVA